MQGASGSLQARPSSWSYGPGPAAGPPQVCAAELVSRVDNPPIDPQREQAPAKQGLHAKVSLTQGYLVDLTLGQEHVYMK